MWVRFQCPQGFGSSSKSRLGDKKYFSDLKELQIRVCSGEASAPEPEEMP
jgi:hypothetical protein